MLRSCVKIPALSKGSGVHGSASVVGCLGSGLLLANTLPPAVKCPEDGEDFCADEEAFGLRLSPAPSPRCLPLARQARTQSPPCHLRSAQRRERVQAWSTSQAAGKRGERWSKRPEGEQQRWLTRKSGRPTRTKAAEADELAHSIDTLPVMYVEGRDDVPPAFLTPVHVGDPATSLNLGVCSGGLRTVLNVQPPEGSSRVSRLADTPAFWVAGSSPASPTKQETLAWSASLMRAR